MTIDPPSYHPWLAPSEMPVLEINGVHVWLIGLEPGDLHRDILRRLLTSDEMSRAARFHFEKDSEHFFAARGQMRAILARYLSVDANQLGFRYGSKGKPRLQRQWGGESVRFNLSHSGEWALVAVALDREVGVDIERIREELATESMARTSFSPQENAVFLQLPEDLRVQGFFNCWTRKEALIKAVGEGVSYGLDQFDVSLRPEESAKLLSIRKDPKELERWSLRQLFPPSGYTGALAVEGHDWRLSCFRWPPAWSDPGTEQRP